MVLLAARWVSCSIGEKDFSSATPCSVLSLSVGWLEVVLDRRLMQDDFRGMGQGVKDNKVTMETFKLLIERRFSNANVSATCNWKVILHLPHITSLSHSPQQH